MTRIPGIVLTVAGLSGTSLHAAVLFQDNFTTNGALNGRLPDTAGSTAWSANSSFTTLDGVGKFSGSSQSMASIDLGANYFTTNPGVYQLSMDVAFLANASPGSGVWGIGFTAGTSTTAGQSMANSDQAWSGTPWVFLRENGNAVLRYTNTTDIASVSGNTAGSTYNLRIVLDTTQAQWTYAEYIGNTQIGTTASISPNSSLRYIAITSTTTLGSIDNFTFTGPLPIPEAGTSAIAALAFSGCLLRRRR